MRRSLSFPLLLLSALGLATLSCKSLPSQNGGRNESAVDVSVIKDGYHMLDILYATDRNKISGAHDEDRFGTKRARLGRSNANHYGISQVSIPKEHKIGRVEKRNLSLRQFRWDPKLHIYIHKVADYGEEEFLENIRERLKRSERKEIIVYIHGYNNSFGDGLWRMAQLAYDLDILHVPILYSWASANETTAYANDEDTIYWSTPHFSRFIESITRLSKEQNAKVNIVAHSMGTRLATEGLIYIKDRRDIYKVEMELDLSEDDRVIVSKSGKKYTLVESEPSPYIVGKTFKFVMIDPALCVQVKQHAPDAVCEHTLKFDEETVWVDGVKMVYQQIGKKILIKDPRFIDELILAAPDIGAQHFAENVVPALKNIVKRTSLYTSNGDRALEVSAGLHRVNRAGDSSDGVLVVKDLETIDASSNEGDIIGHSYYGDDRNVIEDMFKLIRAGLGAKDRNLLEDEKNGHKFWRIRE